MSLDANNLNQQLNSSASATSNLNISCQGILDTHIAQSSSPWYGTLVAELQAAQNLAQEWLANYSNKLNTDILTSIVNCGQSFTSERADILNMFDNPVNGSNGSPLQGALIHLQQMVQTISTNVSNYETLLRNWGEMLQQAHDNMAATIGQIQAQENDLSSQIKAINTNIATLQEQIKQDRKVIAEAESHRTTGIIETIFGVVFAPFTGGLSLILAGIGVSSIAEAQSKVEAMEQTIKDYQTKIVSAQQNLNQDQAQLVTLQALTFSAGIALSDMEVALQMLDSVKTTWDTFSQEMSGVINKISKAENAGMLVVEKAWFNAACDEWAVIVSGAQALMGIQTSNRSVSFASSDVPVVRIVPTNTHPAIPADMKIDPSPGPNDLSLAPNCPVLSWGNYTYWVADYVDNRLAMCILAFDASNKVIKQIAKNGARYIWKMTLDPNSNTLTCYGQSNQTISANLSELKIS